MLRGLCALLAVTTGLAGPSSCVADRQADLERLVQPLIDEHMIGGCVIGVVHRGERDVFGMGEVELGGGEAPDGKTIYEIGSVTKAFTGTLLAEMVARGEANLDDPIQQWLPEGVTAPIYQDQPITLVALATHTSGLPRLADNMDLSDLRNPYAEYTTELLYDFLKSHKLRRGPGEYEYSNYGMGLLGALLARRADKSYEAIVVERIAQPLGMNDTKISLTEADRKRLAPPYTPALTPASNWDIPALAGAGAVRSTADDLMKLVEAALDTEDKRPAAAAIRAACQKKHGKEGEIGVGLGWHLARDGVTWWHNGQTGGYAAWVSVTPKEQLGVVVLTNASTSLATEVGEKICQFCVHGKVAPFVVRKTIVVDEATLKKYCGQYALAPFFIITVTLEEGILMAQATGQEKFPIFPESPTKFFYKVVDAQLTFGVNADGEVTKLTLHQNGLDQPAVKLPDGKKD